jgi:porin
MGEPKMKNLAETVRANGSPQGWLRDRPPVGAKKGREGAMTYCRMPSQAWWRAIGVTVLFSLIPAAGAAQSLEGWLSGDKATGDWGGLRSDLQNRGIDFSASYTDETAGNPTGGHAQGIRYAHEIEFGVDLDFEKLMQLSGSKLLLLFAESAGRDLSAEKIGNLFAVQEVFHGRSVVRLAELSMEQSLIADRLNLKAGRVVAGDDFARLDIFCNFQSGAFCDIPAALEQNSGFTDAPIASWGGRIKFAPVGEFYIETGAYEVNPTLVKQGNGFKLSTDGATGVIVPLQVGWEPKQGLFGLPGTYLLGGYYDTSDVPDVTDAAAAGGPTRLRHGRWGIYVLGQQTVYREAPDSKRGLTLFIGAVFGDARTADIQYFAEVGLVYQGTFNGRDDDTINLAMAHGRINDRLIDAEREANSDAPGSTIVQSAETVIEVNYGAAITPWLDLRPGLQYIIDPGADDRTPDALVLDFQTAVKF